MGVVSRTSLESVVEVRDTISKKMQSLKGETDGLYATINKFEESTKEYQRMAEQADCDIRGYGKKVQQLEIGFDETNDKLVKATESLEEKEKHFKEVEQVMKKVKVYESKCMNNEVTIEEYDKNLRATTKMASDNEQKLDELSRKLGVQEDELKR